MGSTGTNPTLSAKFRFEGFARFDGFDEFGPMMRCSFRTVMLWLVASAALAASAQTVQESTRADREWIGSVSGPAFDLLMPMTLPPGAFVAYRSYHDLAVGPVEVYFVVEYPASEFNRLSATVLVPADRSVRLQLVDLRRKEPDAPLERLVGQLAVRRVKLDVNSCPSLLQRMDALSGVVITVPDRRSWVSGQHDFVHQFSFAFDSLEVRQATVRDQESPLVRWAVETNKALLACAARAANGTLH